VVHGLLAAGDHDLSAPVPVEQLSGVVVGSGDEAVEGHAHVGEDLGSHGVMDLPEAHESSVHDGGSIARHQSKGLGVVFLEPDVMP
jgi:hypothetical protein